MKLLVVLFAAMVLLLGFSPVGAAPRNLLVNGSFEDGYTGWQMSSQYSLSGDAVCGSKSLNLERGWARQVGYKLVGGKTYTLTLQYKGLLLLSAREGRFLYSNAWKKFSVTFTAERSGDTVWLAGFDKYPLLVDCIELVRVPKNP